MSIEDQAIYPTEAEQADTDPLRESRGLVCQLGRSLLMWATLLVAVCGAIALILPGKAG